MDGKRSLTLIQVNRIVEIERSRAKLQAFHNREK